MHQTNIHNLRVGLNAGIYVKQSTFQLNALMSLHWSDVDKSRALSSSLHQLVISEHIATAASYHLILLLLLYSLASPPPPSLNPLSSSSSSPPAFKCMALPCQASLCRQHHSSQPLQREGGGRGTGWMVISLCSRGGGGGCKGKRRGRNEPAKPPPPLPCSTNNRLGDESRPESGRLTSLPERKMV